MRTPTTAAGLGPAACIQQLDRASAEWSEVVVVVVVSKKHARNNLFLHHHRFCRGCQSQRPNLLQSVKAGSPFKLAQGYNRTAQTICGALIWCGGEGSIIEGHGRPESGSHQQAELAGFLQDRGAAQLLAVVAGPW